MLRSIRLTSTKALKKQTRPKKKARAIEWDDDDDILHDGEEDSNDSGSDDRGIAIEQEKNRRISHYAIISDDEVTEFFLVAFDAFLRIYLF